MFNSDFYTAQPHRSVSSSSSSGFPSPSMSAPAHRPPPAGVLAPDLARPISVRDLAHARAGPAAATARTSAPAYPPANRSNVPTTPPLSPPPARFLSGGFADFGIPRAHTVYAATSGVHPSWDSPPGSQAATRTPADLSTHSEAGDLSSLAYRNIDQLSNEDVYNYASHLQGAAQRFGDHLTEAYAQRDRYRSQVAELKEQLHRSYVQADMLRRDRERFENMVTKLTEDNTQLRQTLAEAEGQVRSLTAKMTLQGDMDPSAVIRGCHARLAHKDAQLRELMDRLDRQAAEYDASLESARQRSTEGGADPRLSTAAGAATQSSIDLSGQPETQRDANTDDAVEARVRHELEAATSQAVAAATAELEAELTCQQERCRALEERAVAEATAYAAALTRAGDEITELGKELAAVKQACAQMRDNEEELTAALARRAPASVADFEALQQALARSEAEVRTLQEQQNAFATQEAYLEVLQQSLTAAQTEKQALAEEKAQLQLLAENLREELRLSDTANQLRQRQVETVIARGDEVEQAEHAHVAQLEAELQHARSDAESMQALVAEKEAEAHAAVLMSQRMREFVERFAAVANTGVSHGWPNVEQEASELLAEVAAFGIVVPAAAPQHPSAPAAEVRATQQSQEETRTESPAQPRAENLTAVAAAVAQNERDQAEDLAAMEAARQCIAALQQELEDSKAAQSRSEADAQMQIHALEDANTKLTDELRRAIEKLQQAEDAERSQRTTAEAAGKHQKDVIQALVEELEITQAQNSELRTSASASAARCAAQMQETEDLRQRVADYERRLSEVQSRERTPPSTQPATVSARLSSSSSSSADVSADQSKLANMTMALQQLAERLAESEERVQCLDELRVRQTEELEHFQRTVGRLEEQCTSYENAAKSASNASSQQASAIAAEHRTSTTQLEKDLSDALARVAQLTAANHAAKEEVTSVQKSLQDAQERASAAEADVRAKEAALDAMAAQLLDSKQRSDTLEAEKAQLTGELERVQRALAELESQAAAGDRTHAEWKQATDGLAAQVAQLTSESTHLKDEVARLKSELSVARGAVASLAEERDGHSAADAEVRARLDAAESRVSAVSAERDAMQERASAAEADVRAKEAALDEMAAQLLDSKQRSDALEAEKGMLSSTNAELTAELERVQRNLSEMQVQAEELEREVARARAELEKVNTDSSSQVDHLQKEVQRLKTELSVARTAVASVADDMLSQKERGVALTREVEAEAALRTAAEAEVSKLKLELQTADASIAQLRDDLAICIAKSSEVEARRKDLEDALASLGATHTTTVAELVEIRQRAETLQSTLQTTLDSLDEHKTLVQELNDNGADLNAQLAERVNEVETLRQALAETIREREDARESLAATEVSLQRTTELYSERIVEEDRVQEELQAVTAAFAAQTEQVKLGMAHVVDMSVGLRHAVEVVMTAATTTLQEAANVAARGKKQGEESEGPADAADAAPAVTAPESAEATLKAIVAALEPWSAAVGWVKALEPRLQALEKSNAKAVSVSQDKADTEAAAAATPPASLASRAVGDDVHARSLFLDFIGVQDACRAHLCRIRQALAERDHAIAEYRDALDNLAVSTVSVREAYVSLMESLRTANRDVARAEAQCEEERRLSDERNTAQLILARTNEQRANAARARAEEALDEATAELRVERANVATLEEKIRKLERENERRSRFTARPTAEAHARPPRGVAMDTDAAPGARYTISVAAVEEMEQAHLLQVSSLQGELMLSRRQARKLEEKESTLRQAYVVLEQQVNELRADAEQAVQLREEVEVLRADNVDLEERCEELQRKLTAATSGGIAQELKQLRQQLKVREAEVEEERGNLHKAVLSKSASDLEAAPYANLRKRLGTISTHLTMAEAQYGGGDELSDRTTTTTTTAAGATGGAGALASPQSVLASRNEHLLTLLHEHEERIERLQADLLQSRVKQSTLEEKLAEKTTALSREEGLIEQYAETVEMLGAVAATATPTRRYTEGGRANSRPHTSSVPPPTPLSLHTAAEIGEESVSRVVGDEQAMPSPAPRMPNLDAVAAEGEEEVASDNEAEETSVSPPASTRRRTGTAGQQSSRGGRRASAGSASLGRNAARTASTEGKKSAPGRKRSR